MHILENSTLKIFTETENDVIMTMKLKKYCLLYPEVQMNQKLKQVLEDCYRTIKEIRPNYRTCYHSFLEYCDMYYSQCSFTELFEDQLDIFDMKRACKLYIESSKKATSIEAIQRFLTAMDFLFRYLKENGIRCKKMETGCRRKDVVHDICINLNHELEQKIYLPFDGEKELKIVEEQIVLLNRQNFYQLGQSIIYRLLVAYGFKEKVVINFKLHDFDSQRGKLLVNCNGENSLLIHLPEDIHQDLVEYCSLNKYRDREYLFTKSNGALLTPDSMLGTLKSRVKKMGVLNFTPTTVALYGVVHLIDKGLTLGEIKILTGFETQKIEDVFQYLLTEENVDKAINEKLRRSHE